MPKSTDGPFLWHEGLRKARQTFSIHRIAEPVPAPYLFCISSLCLAPTASLQWTNGMANQNGGTKKTRNSPAHNSRVSLGILKESWGMDTSSKSQSWGATYRKTYVYFHRDNATPSNAFSGWGLYDLELEVGEDFRGQENSHRGRCAGTWGLNLNSINLHQRRI